MRMLSWVAAAALASGTGFIAAPAQASGGCLPGYHPTLIGCHANERVRVVVAPPVMVAPRVVVVPHPAYYYPYHRRRYYAW